MAKSKTRIKKQPRKAIEELERIADALGAKDDSVKAGLPRGSNDYPDGTSVIMVGAVHEFGSPSRGIPERSYLRSTIFENRKKYRLLIKKLSKRVVKGEIDKYKALQILGLTMQTDIREKIINLSQPELKYREGNPLYNTGHLLESVVYQVGEDAD